MAIISLNKNKNTATRKVEYVKRKEKLDKWAKAKSDAKSNVSEYKT